MKEQYNTKRTIITAERYHQNYFQDIWYYRELLLILCWRDITVRYKQTIIGILWAVLRPMITMLIFTFVFGYIAGFSAENETPYYLVVLCGLLPWQFFSQSVNDCSQSIINNEPLITKVYFPRVILLLAAIITATADLLITFILLSILLMYNGIWFKVQIVFLPLFIFLTAVLALGLGFFLAALNVRFRDFRYAIPFVLQLGLYLSPIGFSTSVIPDVWVHWYELNPMVGIIEGYRWSILGGELPSNIALISSVIWAGFLFILGFYFFTKTERTFSDLI